MNAEIRRITEELSGLQEAHRSADITPAQKKALGLEIFQLQQEYAQAKRVFEETAFFLIVVQHESGRTSAFVGPKDPVEAQLILFEDASGWFFNRVIGPFAEEDSYLIPDKYHNLETALKP